MFNRNPCQPAFLSLTGSELVRCPEECQVFEKELFCVTTMEGHLYRTHHYPLWRIDAWKKKMEREIYSAENG